MKREVGRQPHYLKDFFRKLCRPNVKNSENTGFEDQVRDILEHDTRARPECYEDMSLNNWNQSLVFLEKNIKESTIWYRLPYRKRLLKKF